MFDGEGDPDYKGGLEELEQNLLLQQLDEIIEAFESKEGVGKAVTMKSGQHGISNHSIKPTVLMERRQGRKVGWVLLMYKSKRLHKNMKGLMEVKLTR